MRKQADRHIQNTVTQQRYLEAMIANTSDAIIALNQEYRILDLNAAACASLRYERQEALGRDCTEVLHCQNLNRMKLCGTSSCPMMRVLDAKKLLSNEELLLGKEPDSVCEASVCVTPVTTEGESYVVFTARDMSSLKVANRVRSNFVSMVSHELRTPLNSVHGFIDLLLQGHMGELNEEQRTYLGYTQEGVQQLVSIVEDIVFMTRSDMGQFQIKQQEFSFCNVAKQVLSGLQLQAKKAEVALCQDIAPSSPTFYIDPLRIRQVLNNLIANAIKFTPPGGTVTVKVDHYNEHFALISVCDTGFGIPSEDQPHVFERFYQSNHNEQSKMGGYGLGLSIARLIVEQHGGFIDFTTQLDKGTTFFFTIPLYTRQDAPRDKGGS